MSHPPKVPSLPPDRDLSTLELTILGIVWLRGPCTTYSVMRVLEGAASSYHRSRAGATYSVVKRLLSFGLIVQEDGLVKIAPEGMAALRGWVAGPVPPGEVAHTADLIRLRFHFLEALEPEERVSLIDQALEELQEFEGQLVGLIGSNQEAGEFFGALAAVGSILETRARIRWLTLVRPLVSSPLGGEVDWRQALVSVATEDRK